jgi:O-antigen/teichoic acid export membrane protein
MKRPSLIRRLGANTGLVLGSEMLRKLLALALQLIAVRFFGDAGYGRYTFALGFVGLWVLGNDFGLAELTVREVAREESRAAGYLVDVLCLKLILGAATLGALALVGGSTQPGELYMIVWAGLGAVIFAGSREAALGVVKGRQDFRLLFIINLVGDVLTLGLGYLAVLLRTGPEGLITATAAAGAVSALVSLVWAARRYGIVKPRPRRWLSLLRRGLPFALASLFIVLYKLVDITMLKYMVGDDRVVGWYGAAVRLYNVLLFLPTALSAALFPALSELSGDKARLTRTTSAAVRLLTAVALPVAALFAFHAEPIAAAALGEGYGPAADALRILGLALPFVFAGYPLAVLLKSAGGEKAFAWISLGGGLFNVLANLYAIPRWEHVGAAWTTLITEILVLVAFVIAARRYLDDPELRRPLGGTLLSGALYALACGFLPLLWALACLPLYLVALYLSGAVGRSDLERLRAGLRRGEPAADNPSEE